uniref:Putative glycosyltransferase family 17 n=1 Tax=Ixodes ricinus TaxID=34613 RepID=A0A6B0VBZ2_IXORI
MFPRIVSNARFLFIAILVIVVHLLCYQVFLTVKLGRSSQHTVRGSSPSASGKGKLVSECSPYGTDLSASKESCVCLKGWTGEGCSVPQAVWDSYGFQTWYRKGYIKRRPRPRTIINSLVFNHELDMLEIRVNELHDAVDYFLVCEANFTYFGDPKPLHLKSNLSAGFLSRHRHKIIRLEISTNFVANEDPFAQENYLRSSIWKKGRHEFSNLSDDDLFMISDADEIPSREVMLFLKYHDGFGEPISLNLRWFVYGFFWEYQQPVNVGGICSVGYLREVFHNDSLLVRDKRFRKMNATTGGTGTVWTPWAISGTPRAYAGWHCSWCFDAAGIQVKLISAQRDDGVRWGDFAAKRDVGYINYLRRTGRYFDESKPFQRVDGYKAAPSYLGKDVKRWRYLLSV